MSTVFTVAHPSMLERDFSQIRNSIIEHPTLSMEARCLLTYLISKAHLPNWTFHDNVILGCMRCGVSKLKSMFKELRAAGYVRRVPIKDKSGNFVGSKREFSDQPIFLSEPESTEGLKYNPSGKGYNPDVPKSNPSYNNTDLVTNTDLERDNTQSDSHSKNKKPDKVPKDKIPKQKLEEWFNELFAQYPVKEDEQAAKVRFLGLFSKLDRVKSKNLYKEIIEGLTLIMLERSFYEIAQREFPAYAKSHFFQPSWQRLKNWLREKSWINGNNCKTSYQEVLTYVASQKPGFNPNSTTYGKVFNGGSAG